MEMRSCRAAIFFNAKVFEDSEIIL